MHKLHEHAETLLRRVIGDLQRLLPQDGEDISCYHHTAIDDPLHTLIEVRTLMARADDAKETP